MKTGMIEEAGYSEGINILKQDLIKMQKLEGLENEIQKETSSD